MPIQNTLETLADGLASFQGGRSVAGMPAGAHGGGRKFEQLVAKMWRDFVLALGHIANVGSVDVGGKIITYVTSKDGKRVVYFDSLYHTPPRGHSVAHAKLPTSWLQKDFEENDLLSWFPGARVYDYAPPTPKDSPRYHGKNYLKISEKRNTEFDGFMVLAQDGNLIEKLLFEYKSAKSTGGASIDGNAHERLAFQALQYLEIAQHFPRTTFNVFASTAFANYKNKYHPAFHQQADRLNHAFSSFRMRFLSCRTEYLGVLTAIADFLQKGQWSI